MHGAHPREMWRSWIRGVAMVAVATAGTGGSAGAQESCCRSSALELAAAHRVSGLDDRRFTHERYWNALAPVLESDRIRSEVLGESLEGRTIRALTLGTGPTRVLLWSQMHGDESAASMALADIANWFASAPPDDSLWSRLSGALTITMIPMLNPDGAERFRRENAVGIDINRDARRLATPEGRILKAVRDSIDAQFGFNLHDQGTRTAGDGGDIVAIALLAPAADEERSWGPVRQKAREVASVIVRALAPEIGTRMARYDDEFAPRAFGDNMQAWGTSTVLIESGELPDDPQKQELRKLNVVALVSALHEISTGMLEDRPTAAYDDLPMNVSLSNDLLLFGGTLIVGDLPPVRADVTIRYEDSVARTGPRWGEIGDLADVAAADTIDARGMYIHAEPADDGTIRAGQAARLTLRHGRDPDSESVLTIGR
ncbi:MAG: M14 family zinc carboxypeptidase [Gemmatimonadota bacterium]